ncbi:MAG: hypothetical protein Q9177_006190 [Variospora cf. flavescens]
MILTSELVVALLLAVCTAYITRQTILSPLKHVPGPYLAKLTNIYLLFIYYRRRQYPVTRHLHDRYGAAVRIGPNHVSLNDPTLIKKIYDMKGQYVKTPRYRAADSISPEGHNIPVPFSTLDERINSAMWRPIAKYYTLTHLLNFEPHIDTIIRTMQRQLEERFCSGKALCNVHTWLSYSNHPQLLNKLFSLLTLHPAAWEVTNMVNFSQMLGFLEKGEDIEGSLADAIFAGDTFTYLGHLPWLERLLRALVGKPIFNGVLQFCLKQIADRRSMGDYYIHSPPDFLDNFLAAHKADPRAFSNDTLLSQLVSNVAAGGDTAGGTMTGIVYNTLQHPRVLARLQQELDAAIPDPKDPISWHTASQLPYLDAVIQESIRFHPGTSFALERFVPRDGLFLSPPTTTTTKDENHGIIFLPAGTIVSMHPWALNRDPSIFGPDADSFIPERWLPNLGGHHHTYNNNNDNNTSENNAGETPEAFSARVSAMKDTILTFGKGKRRCVGRHLADLEMYKVVAMLLRGFEFELMRPERDEKKVVEPKVVHSIFVRMEGFEVGLKRRD